LIRKGCIGHIYCKPKKAISKELGEDIIVRVDPKKKSIVGLQYLILQNVLKNRK
jgi:hypothetical protein